MESGSSPGRRKREKQLAAKYRAAGADGPGVAAACRSAFDG
jgi:hypothetical protein